MSEFCLNPLAVLAMLDEISRHRALTDHESYLLQTAMGQDESTPRWTPKMETQLLAASRTSGGIARFARTHGFTNHDTVYQKLARLRRRSAQQGQRQKG